MMQIQILYQPYAEAPEDLAALLDPGISVKWGNPLQGGENFNVLGTAKLRTATIQFGNTSLDYPFRRNPRGNS
jgi:hypothetical protein